VCHQDEDPSGAGGGPRYDLPIIPDDSGPTVEQAPADARREGSDQPLTRLRGATVEVDPRQVRRVIVVLGLVGLAAAVVALTVVGVDKNAEITGLRQQGVPVDVTVTTCRGLLGGSGSNGAGNACYGTFVFAGKTYRSAIPGTNLYGPGTTLRLLTIRGNPGLLSTVRQLRAEHASWKVFLLPAVLLALLIALLAALVVRLRRSPGDAGSVGVRLGTGLVDGRPLLR
jgi:hypothetical protein